MRAVVFDGAGGNEVVGVVERPDPTVGPDDVLVSVRFAGMNPADLLQRAGGYPAPPGSPPDIPGLEVAGEVIVLGERVAGWSIGDRVFGLVGGGGLSDRVAVHERCVTRVPETLTDAQAAAVPEAFITAHDAAITQAGLRMGEILLVHGAAGAVGAAAVQIGIGSGARVIGSVRSERGATVVRGFGAEAVDDETFAAQVDELTAGRGVNVIIELVGSPHFPANLDVLAIGGRVMVVGVQAGDEVTLPLRQLMRRRASIRGTGLRMRPLEQKAAAVRAFEREVVPLLADERAQPSIDSTFPVDEVRAAFDRLSAPGKTGKVLLGFS